MCKVAMALALLGFATSAAAVDFQLTRWSEDYRAYADAGRRASPLEAIKYVPLGAAPDRYLSFGGQLRLKSVAMDAPLFGLGAADADGYLLQRVNLHADLHAGAHWRAFVEISDARAHDKDRTLNIDSNRVDLQQAFVDGSAQLFGMQTVLRLGRQELMFDSAQRFVALREGPNVRRGFEGLRWGATTGPWRVDAFHTRPVEVRDAQGFDDRHDDGGLFSGLRVRRGEGDLRHDAYVYRYTRDDASFAGQRADESRYVFGVQSAGRWQTLDWDVEAVYQSGQFGDSDVRAWAFGSMLGHSWSTAAWRPRLGLQLDAASGDRDPEDDRLQTFNSLFPKGSYFSQSGLTDFANLLHAGISLGARPWQTSHVGIMLGKMARESRADAVYAQPLLPVPRSVVEDRAIGDYLRLNAQHRFSRHVSLAVEVLRYWPATALRRVGAERTDYAELVLRCLF